MQLFAKKHSFGRFITTPFSVLENDDTKNHNYDEFEAFHFGLHKRVCHRRYILDTVVNFVAYHLHKKLAHNNDRQILKKTNSSVNSYIYIYIFLSIRLICTRSVTHIDLLSDGHQKIAQ